MSERKHELREERKISQSDSDDPDKSPSYIQHGAPDSPSASPASSGSELLTPAHVIGKRTTFDTSELSEFYKPIDSYEGRHRFDPDFQWDAQEEKKIVRKDLKMNTNGTRWIPIQMVSWSLIAACQAFLQNKSSYYVCRALLGIMEGGFIPDNVLYLSYFYKSAELPTRLSLFWVSYEFTYIVSALAAYGILHMSGISGLAGWRWLFALEGTVTGLIGIATYFYLPPSPCQTASWFRGKNGWFTPHEEKIMVNRILRDDPSKGDMHNRQAVDFGGFWKCLCDRHMWPIYFLGLCWMLPFYPSQSQYLTLILRSDGFTTFQTNLLTIPAYVLFIINLLFWTQITEWLNERFLLVCVNEIWCMAALIALEVMPAGTSGNLRWGRYACTVLLAGSPYFHAIIVAITSRNAGSVRTRTVASAIYNMSVQASNIIGSQIYRNNDKPYYRKGNIALLVLTAWNICALVSTKFFYVSVNSRRERVWNDMSKEEKEHYLATTKDEGNRRYVHLS
ncbi:MAG: hypothetical protein Q9162_005298 [Coniocarpon cinnabarinum]